MKCNPDLGEVLDGYRLEQVLGEGGFGIVYKAIDLALQRPVAIKTLKDLWTESDEVAQRFRRGAKALARTNHPGIVRIFKTFEREKRTFLVMEFLDYPTLQEVLVKKRFSLQESLHTAEHIASAVAHAHSKGVIHRDLKPNNIASLPGGEIKLFDFGIALVRGASFRTSTSENRSIGTPEYMSPEQCVGNKVDEKTDVYAMGIILYEMLAGRPPFLSMEGDSEAVRYMQRYEPVPPLSRFVKEIPEEVERWVNLALKKRMDDRIPTARAFAAGLKQLRNKKNTVVKSWKGESLPQRSWGSRVRAGLLATILPISFFTAWHHFTSKRESSLSPSMLAMDEGGAMARISGISNHPLPSQNRNPQHENQNDDGKETTKEAFTESWPANPPTDRNSTPSQAESSQSLSSSEVSRIQSIPAEPIPMSPSFAIDISEPSFTSDILHHEPSIPISPVLEERSHADAEDTTSFLHKGRKNFEEGISLVQEGALPKALHRFEAAKELFEEIALEHEDVWPLVHAARNAIRLCDRMIHKKTSKKVFESSMAILRIEVLGEDPAHDESTSQ